MNWHTRVTQARTAKNLKKSELARLVGVSPATVTLWESGQTKKIEGLNLIKVCDILDISPSWLLGEQDRDDEAQNFKHVTERMPVHMALAETMLVRFYPDDNLRGYRTESETELEIPSMFAYRRQWLWSNGLEQNSLYAMRMKSTDMEPAIVYGDILVLDSSQSEISDGSIYVMLYENEVLVRRALRDTGDWWLTSDHTDQRRYARKRYRPEDVKIIGKVILRQTEHI